MSSLIPYILFGECLKEAGIIAGVAYRSSGFGFDQDGIAVAVLPDGAHDEAVAGGRSLVPELLAATTVKPDLAAGESAAQ